MPNFCIKCGSKLKDDYNFCGNCGTKIDRHDDMKQNNSSKSRPDKREKKKIIKEQKKAIMEQEKAEIAEEKVVSSKKIEKNEIQGGYCNFSCKHYMEEFIGSDGGLDFDYDMGDIVDHYCDLGHSLAYGSFCKDYKQ